MTSTPPRTKKALAKRRPPSSSSSPSTSGQPSMSGERLSLSQNAQDQAEYLANLPEVLAPASREVSPAFEERKNFIRALIEHGWATDRRRLPALLYIASARLRGPCSFSGRIQEDWESQELDIVNTPNGDEVYRFATDEEEEEARRVYEAESPLIIAQAQQEQNRTKVNSADADRDLDVHRAPQKPKGRPFPPPRRISTATSGPPLKRMRPSTSRPHAQSSMSIVPPTNASPYFTALPSSSAHTHPAPSVQPIAAEAGPSNTRTSSGRDDLPYETAPSSFYPSGPSEESRRAEDVAAPPVSSTSAARPATHAPLTRGQFNPDISEIYIAPSFPSFLPTSTPMFNPKKAKPSPIKFLASPYCSPPPLSRGSSSRPSNHPITDGSPQLPAGKTPNPPDNSPRVTTPRPGGTGSSNRQRNSSTPIRTQSTAAGQVEQEGGPNDDDMDRPRLDEPPAHSSSRSVSEELKIRQRKQRGKGKMVAKENAPMEDDADQPAGEADSHAMDTNAAYNQKTKHANASPTHLRPPALLPAFKDFNPPSASSPAHRRQRLSVLSQDSQPVKSRDPSSFFDSQFDFDTSRDMIDDFLITDMS